MSLCYIQNLILFLAILLLYDALLMSDEIFTFIVFQVATFNIS